MCNISLYIRKLSWCIILIYTFVDTFQTDTTISKYNGQPLGEKVLEMWEPPAMNGDSDDFDLNSGSNSAVSYILYIYQTIA